MGDGEQDFGAVWRQAPEAVRRCPALAYEALAAGGLAVGTVLTDAAGTALCEGRNEAYEEGPGRGPCAGRRPCTTAWRRACRPRGACGRGSAGSGRC
ncbi:hypothetical protein AB0D66_05550 [Streptomyces sp. NPDC048270]|uniref:hypothetical protein n=1 Tax=Streptomyces sp. NPDC048270 TaxID=3154615 RepID=UPI00340D891E